MNANPPPGSPADDMTFLAAPRRRLADALERHTDAVRGFMLGGDGNIWDIDLFVAGIANRSYYLVRGFLAAFDDWNVFAAAPLVRLQVDSLVRLSYAAHAPSAHLVVQQVLSGRKFSGLKDADGKQLSDRRLVGLAAEHHPWVGHVYSSGNEWVHLSKSVVLVPFEVRGDTPAILSFTFPRRGDAPESFYTNMLEAMAEATDDILTYLDFWRRRKGLPLGEARE